METSPLAAPSQVGSFADRSACSLHKARENAATLSCQLEGAFALGVHLVAVNLFSRIPLTLSSFWLLC